MSPTVLRALEDLLRRVLRAPDHGIDVAGVSAATRRQAALLRARRHTRTALLVAMALALLLIGWSLRDLGAG